METQFLVLYLGMMAPTSPLLPTLSLSLSSLCVEVEVYQKKLSGASSQRRKCSYYIFYCTSPVKNHYT
jgi:hypothetical protein